VSKKIKSARQSCFDFLKRSVFLALHPQVYYDSNPFHEATDASEILGERNENRTKCALLLREWKKVQKVLFE